jgi:glycosyltransferase involved in cell wall biosynthesis
MQVDVRIAADSAWYPTPVSLDGEPGAEHIELRSYGDYWHLRELYADATVVVVPLHEARFACGYAVIAEAMAMGKPVIATRTSTPCDYLRHGDTGLLVTPGNPAELAAALERVLGDDQLASTLGERARAEIAARYSLEAYVDRIAAELGLPVDTRAC